VSPIATQSKPEMTGSGGIESIETVVVATAVQPAASVAVTENVPFWWFAVTPSMLGFCKLEEKLDGPDHEKLAAAALGVEVKFKVEASQTGAFEAAVSVIVQLEGGVTTDTVTEAEAVQPVASVTTTV
jgi:hypothetical protein